MSRYIDADRLKRVLEKTWKGSSPDLSDVLHKIDRQPTVDAADVVYCKDCRYMKLVGRPFPLYFCSILNRQPASHSIYGMGVDGEFFCSYGERKNDERKD